MKLLTDQGHVPELPPRGRPRLVGRHAGAPVPVGQQIQMRVDLAARLLVQPPARSGEPEPRDDRCPHLRPTPPHAAAAR
jgi:hypothetical protein